VSPSADAHGQERDEGKKLFLKPDSTELSELALSISSAAGAPPPKRTFLPGSAPASGGEKGRLLSEEERARVRKAIETASSVEEMRRLRRMLDEGAPCSVVVARLPLTVCRTRAAERRLEGFGKR
jgi:hypothetical protein